MRGFRQYETLRIKYIQYFPKKRKKQLFNPVYKRISDEKLYLLIKNYIEEKRKMDGYQWASAEKTAEKFQVKKDRIKKIFMKLNQEGLLSKAHKKSNIDSDIWSANSYTITKEDNNV